MADEWTSELSSTLIITDVQKNGTHAFRIAAERSEATNGREVILGIVDAGAIGPTATKEQFDALCNTKRYATGKFELPASENDLTVKTTLVGYLWEPQKPPDLSARP